MGLPAVEFRTRFDPERGVRRFGQAKAAGIPLVWEEHPFEWVEARRMGVLRQFSKGFFNWFISTTDLIPRPGGGTLLRHTFCLEPQNVIGRWVAQLEIGRRTPRALEKLYRQFDQYVRAGELKNPSVDPFQSRSPLTDAQRRRLTERLAALSPYGVAPDLIHALGEYLEHASDQDVARIRPGAFADRFGYDRRAVLKACLAGVRESLLVLLWDILCPRCRIPSDVKEALGAIGDHGHCEACNLDFELDFANSIELVFRAHPEIRNVEVRTYCVGGPAFSTHVVAQLRIAPGERFEVDLGLTEGTYRLRGPQLPYQADFQVTPGARISRWNLDLSRGVTTELAPKLVAGRQKITFDNPLDRELLVRIERSASRADAVTAADASNFALFRELFPNQVLAAGHMASVATVTLLMLQLDGAESLYESAGEGKAFGVVHEAFRTIEDAARNAGGALINTYGDRATCSFSEPVAAVRAAFDLAARFASTASLNGLKIKAAVHRGPAMIANLNERLDYFGNNVRLAHQLLEFARPDELFLTHSVISLPEVDNFLAEQHRDPQLVNVVVPGHPREILQRVRLSA
jgi:class 3 adenylate cyclase